MKRHLYIIFIILPKIIWCQSINEKEPNAPANPWYGNRTLVPQMEAAILFDGVVDSIEWGYIDTLPLVSHWPAASSVPGTRTEFRVAYDEKFLYFSAVCYDDPAHIQAPYFERDKWEMTMDNVNLILDTYNDNENALVFSVSPTGSRIDVSVRNDAQGFEPIDLSWNAYWEAKVTLNDEGWMAEARIPFSSLRFQKHNDTTTMGLIAFRHRPFYKQMDIYPAIPRDWGFWSFVKPSQAKDVSFSGIQNKRPWFTSPYLLSRLGYHHNRLPESPGYEKVSGNKLDVGLDIQHAVSNNMNLDITVNTDFAQVEADDQVVNLSRFSLFFPEKRRFFLERSSIMEFSFEDNNRLFYSRRIGINEGSLIPLWGGVRLVGRLKSFDVGAMTMQSREKFDFPSENFGVLRLRKRISENNSYVGGIITSRTDFTGNTNLTYGLDGIINLFKDDYLKVNLAQSRQTQQPDLESNVPKDRNRIYLQWEDQSNVGFNYSLSYSQVDLNYEPGLGFEMRKDFKAVGDRISWGLFPGEKSSLYYLQFTVNSQAYFSNTSNQLETFLVSPFVQLEWNNRSSVQFTYSRFLDNPPDAFNLSRGIVIQPGKYVNNDLTILYRTPSVKLLNSLFNLTYGNFYEGKRFSASFTPTYTISKYITLNGFYEFNRINFGNSPDYISHVGRFKISSSMNVKLSMNAFVQYNSLSQITLFNFRLRYNPKDGNDLYLVYNEMLNNKGKGDPFLPFSDFRTLTLKYIHTFHIGG
ncbi:MAG: DUF5916 domain-containing protein [Bacteroidota bacterium]